MNCPSCHREIRPGQKVCSNCGHSLSAGTGPETVASSSAELPGSFADGRYRVNRFLGEDGKNRVYLAHDSRLDREVAIGALKTEGLDEAALARLKREAQAMGRLGIHPNLVMVYDVAADGDRHYIVSEFIAGGDL